MADALRRAGHAGVEVRRVDGRNHLSIEDRIAPGDPVLELMVEFATATP